MSNTVLKGYGLLKLIKKKDCKSIFTFEYLFNARGSNYARHLLRDSDFVLTRNLE